MKLFGVQRKAKQQSSPVAFNNTMATIQLQTSPGIGWSLHTLAPGAAWSVCMCVSACVSGWERGRGWKRLLLVAALLEAWHDENQRPSPATEWEEKSLKWFQAKSLCIKSENFLVWEKREKKEWERVRKKHFLWVLNSKFKVHWRKFLARVLVFAAGVREYVRRESFPSKSVWARICIRQTMPQRCPRHSTVTHVFAYDWHPPPFRKRLCKYDMYICMFVVIHFTINP